MSDDLQKYLEQESADAERGFKIGVIALVVIAVVLVAYFQWLKSAVAEMTEPGNVAALITGEVRRNIPAATNALKKGLSESAPDVIEAVVDTVLMETVPALRSGAEALFRDYSRELTTLGVEASGKVFESVVKESKDELRAKMSSDPGMYTTSSLASDLQGFIDREMDKRLNSMPEESMGLKLNQSLVALRNINGRLRSMASGKGKTRKDELGRRLIATWWTMLSSLEPDKTAAEKMLDSRLKPLTHPAGSEDKEK